ncbi:MAG: hypothetical protein KIT02_00945 [Devosia sp.]|uniref:hypothetical protein n=1 Tax=Devosia sp. TaxID=1871048 RepID=UPI0024CD0338|nr:hypothetical protein [Devosia sp.]UYN99842.1 MAG: hypothetical protein KIT02_00945 [Devosia sp.]
MAKLNSFLLATAALASLCVPAMAQDAAPAPLDCTSFMVGEWVGQGEFSGFGQSVELDNRYTFNDDGTFETVNRYKSGDDDWTEQVATGTWTTELEVYDPEVDGPLPEDIDPSAIEACSVTMETVQEGEGFSVSGSSTSSYVKVDEDTFSTMDFEMHRQ